MKRNVNIEKIYLITLILFIVDFFVKRIVVKYVDLFKKIEVIPKFFYISYVQNTGAAWSILDNSTILLSVLSIVAFIIISSYLKKIKEFNKWKILAFGLLLGGILGNFIDRVMYGYVIDYLDFYIFGYNYPVFNIADMCIVVGAFMLIIDVIRGEKHERSSR